MNHKQDPYASEEQTRALLVPDTRTPAEKRLHQLIEAESVPELCGSDYSEALWKAALKMAGSAWESMGYEKYLAIREGYRNKAEDDYFDARLKYDNKQNRMIFCDGFDRGYNLIGHTNPTLESTTQAPVQKSGGYVQKLTDALNDNSDPVSVEAAEFLKTLTTPAAATVIDGNTSDGHHTFNELYEFRKAYNAALFNEWAAGNKYSVHKSWRHHDGDLCFGGGWFIVVAVLPDGQISNHYEAKDWDMFAVPETERALFEYDGHTGTDVIARLKAHTLTTSAQDKQNHGDI